MINDGFKINESDKCVYFKCHRDACVIVCLYVDDMLIFGSHMSIIKTTKKMLCEQFDMKDLGVADFILGIKIIRDSVGIKLSQSHYIESVLRKFNQYESSPARTPYDPNSKLNKNKGEPVSQLEFSRIIGSLMYIMNCTRPDIAYAVGRLSIYTCNPNSDHWNALIRVLRYLKFTLDNALYYVSYPAVIEGYTDAIWISDSEESKSTSGYVFTSGGAAVSWKSSKQTCIARSTWSLNSYL